MPTRILVALGLGVVIVVLVAWFASRSPKPPRPEAWELRPTPSQGSPSGAR